MKHIKRKTPAARKRSSKQPNQLVQSRAGKLRRDRIRVYNRAARIVEREPANLRAGHSPRLRIVFDDTGEERWIVDPTFELTSGAVRADTSKQGGGWRVREFYVDEKMRCRGCDQRFIFSAREQQFWYEELGIPIVSVPSRCAACRKSRRQRIAADSAYAKTVEAVRNHPNDPAACLAYLEAQETRWRLTGAADWNRVIHVARRLEKLAPNEPDAYYYQGLAEAERKRPTQAVERYKAFLLRAARRKGTREKRQHVEQYLETTP